jgi:hypothetical protein
MSELGISGSDGEIEQVTHAMVAAGMSNHSQVASKSIEDIENEVKKIFLAMRAIERSECSVPHLHDNEDNAYILWAEIHRLRWETKGPEGFKNWRDAAINERHLRVKAERDAASILSKANEKPVVAGAEYPPIADLGQSTEEFKNSVSNALNNAGAPLHGDDGKVLSVEERICWLGAKACTYK